MQNVISKIENTLETNFHAKVYSMMTVMLLMTGVIGCLSVYFGLAKTFITHPILFTLLMISELAVVTVLTSKFLKNHDFNTNLLLANTYAGLSGLTFSIGLNVYKPTTLLLGLSATIAVFVLATLYGLFTKRNINSIGGWILLTLIGVIIALIVNTFLYSTVLMYVISIVSVIAFTVSTAWVSQMIEKQSLEDSSSGSAINCAITIYLNFVNLFLNIVRLFGGFGDND